MTKAEKLQELLSLLNKAQDLIEEIYGDADEAFDISLLNKAQDLIEEIYGDADEAFDMTINLSNVISDVEVEIDFEDIKLDQNLTINGLCAIIES